VFAFLHPSLPQRPLVFVNCALMKQAPDNVACILTEPVPSDAEHSPSTCVFYSITSTHSAFQGIDLANLLIKRVSKEIHSEFPSLTTFITLSPIPGFRAWLEGVMKKQIDDSLFQASEQDAKELLQSFLSSSKFTSDPQQLQMLKPVLMRLCARYLLTERRGGASSKVALDPVANFHIRNGAMLYRINWQGDLSRRGIENSYGMMVNYKYNEDDIAKNHQQYVEQGLISTSIVLDDQKQPRSQL